MTNIQADVAPHGIVFLAALALIVVLAVHLLGFRIVGAVKLGR